MLVVDKSWTGPEIFPRLMVPELSRAFPSPWYGMGADTSGRLLRRVKVRLKLGMARSDE